METTHLRDKYGPRVMALLESFKAALESAGHTVEGPWDCSADQHRWEMNVDRKPDDDNAGCGLSFILMESDYYDGTDDGINFDFDILAWGGALLGRVVPYNYTQECWVPLADEAGIEARFSILESIEPAEVVATIERHSGVRS